MWELEMAGIPQTGNFEVCNIGLTAAKEIQITDKFSLPVSGALIWNPAKRAVSCGSRCIILKHISNEKN